MRDDTGPRRPDTSSTSRPPRRQQPGFPFWVIRGAHAPNSRPAPVTAAAWPAPNHDFAHRPSERTAAGARRQPTAPHTGRTGRTGRTGEDLRAGIPPAPRTAPRSQPATRRRLKVPSSVLPSPRGRRDRGEVPHLPSPRGRRAGGEVRRRRTAVALIALICVQALFLAAIAWGLTSPTFQARDVRIEGTSDPTLLAAIHRLPLAGCNIFRCDLAGRVHLVEALPTVARAEVHTIYPNGLLVVVTPRRPALLWQIGDQSVVVASDGTVLGPLASDSTYATLSLLPISDPSAAAFSGQIPRPGAQIPAVEAEMAAQLRRGVTETLGSGWTLEWTAGTGFVASDGTDGSGSGTRVLFGTPADAALANTSYPNPAALAATPTIAAVDQGVATQLQVLHALRGQLAQSGQHATLIDLRWGPHPYYRLANGT